MTMNEQKEEQKEKDYPMHFQGIFMKSDMDKLKEKTGHTSTKEALGSAVEHYLKCKNTKSKEE